MLTDDDIASIQTDFGTLASKVDCTIKRGTKSTVTGAYGKPYTTAFTWTCTVLSLSQVRDAYIANYARSVVQETKNARVIDLPLPMPSGKDVKRGDYIVVGPDYFQVLDLDNNSTYQFQRTAYCQYVEGGAV